MLSLFLPFTASPAYFFFWIWLLSSTHLSLQCVTLPSSSLSIAPEPSIHPELHRSHQNPEVLPDCLGSRILLGHRANPWAHCIVFSNRIQGFWKLRPLCYWPCHTVRTLRQIYKIIGFLLSISIIGTIGVILPFLVLLIIPHHRNWPDNVYGHLNPWIMYAILLHYPQIKLMWKITIYNRTKATVQDSQLRYR